ncbi:MAG: CopD family protein [Candidatus Midichloria sp.]|nr:MAG: CopD family protein [Candidatus Midichloria sp.]
MKKFVLNNYLLIKSFHIIATICCMAGLFYLPRLFVYHTKFLPKSESYETFLTMGFRLIRYIMTPSMICSFLFRGLLIYAQEMAIWLHAKLTSVLLLAAIHGMMIKYYKNFYNYNNTKSEKFFRLFNEVPTILVILIVIMAVTKP